MSLRLRLVLASLLVTCSFLAPAHEYGEFEPLDEQLRGFLIDLLEEASASGHFNGDPDDLAEAGSSLSARLASIVATATQADIAWLETVEIEALDHPVYGRVPVGLILQRFDELISDVAHFEEHDEIGYDVDSSLRQHISRLERLSSSAWEG